MDVLQYFAQHPQTVISKEELVEKVWDRAIVTDQAITQTIFLLRKCLRDGRRADSYPEYIKTIPKRGYELLDSVKWLTGEMASKAEETSVAEIQEPTIEVSADLPQEEFGFLRFLQKLLPDSVLEF